MTDLLSLINLELVYWHYCRIQDAKLVCGCCRRVVTFAQKHLLTYLLTYLLVIILTQEFQILVCLSFFWRSTAYR